MAAWFIFERLTSPKQIRQNLLKGKPLGCFKLVLQNVAAVRIPGGLTPP
jgi:hypothetical protein